jgi:threonine dehydrogenase-like Zn-dependent dehydrogenase
MADEDAIAEPLACLLSAGQRMAPKLCGDPVAVVGCGYMGLGMITLFKAMGYGRIVGVDIREQARENALKFGASDVYSPETLPREYILNWETWDKPDLTRDGHQTDIFNIGFEDVMEFTGTESGLSLAGELVCAHGRLGIGGYHNDGLRTVDFKLLNMKAITMINCHERRIEYEATLCERALHLISKGIWKFTGATTHFYALEEFDLANGDMESKRGNFIKGAVRCRA